MLDAYHSQLKTGSPCKGVCTTTYDIVCAGCGRTYMEVAEWVTLTEEERDVIWGRLIREGYFPCQTKQTY